MGRKTKNHVCPVERAGSLDTGLRRWLQNPWKIVGPYVEAGMTVMDIGCGPGFFTIDLARMVGPSGQVIAVDLQEGMLQKLKQKIEGTEFEVRITLHQSAEGKIGVTEDVDFALAFYMVHEVPDQTSLMIELASVVKPNGRLMIVEPPFHVSKKEFGETIDVALNAGFVALEQPKILLSKAVVLRRDAGAVLQNSGLSRAKINLPGD